MSVNLPDAIQNPRKTGFTCLLTQCLPVLSYRRAWFGTDFGGCRQRPVASWRLASYSWRRHRDQLLLLIVTLDSYMFLPKKLPPLRAHNAWSTSVIDSAAQSILTFNVIVTTTGVMVE